DALRSNKKGIKELREQYQELAKEERHLQREGDKLAEPTPAPPEPPAGEGAVPPKVFQEGAWWRVEGTDNRFSTQEQAQRAADNIAHYDLRTETGESPTRDWGKADVEKFLGSGVKVVESKLFPGVLEATFPSGIKGKIEKDGSITINREDLQEG